MFFASLFKNVAGVSKTIFCSSALSVYIGIDVIIRPKWQCNKSRVWAFGLYRLYCFYGIKKS
jgi:hypothetical protein